VVALDLAVGLRSAGPCLLDRGAGPSAGEVPEAGLVAGAVVGEDALAGDASQREPQGGSLPERGGGDGLFVTENLAVDEPGAVIEGGVDVAVAGTCMAVVIVVAPAVQTPPAAGRDRAQLLMSTWINSPGRSR
jgi:hypothetical protein